MPRWARVLSNDGQGRTVQQRRALGIVSRRLGNGAVDHELHQIDGHCIEHHRGDDLIGTKVHLEHTYNTAPDGAAEKTGDHGQRQVDDHGETLDIYACDGGGEGADIQLPLHANIGQTAAISQCIAHTREDEGGILTNVSAMAFLLPSAPVSILLMALRGLTPMAAMTSMLMISATTTAMREITICRAAEDMLLRNLTLSNVCIIHAPIYLSILKRTGRRTQMQRPVSSVPVF